MKKENREAIARALFMARERGALNAGSCSCGRPRDPYLPPELAEAIDAAEAALADEPEGGRFSYLEYGEKN